MSGDRRSDVPAPPALRGEPVTADARDKPKVSRLDRFWNRIRRWIKNATRSAMAAGERLPPGVRSVAGIGLMIGGVFGFLPVLGFWMFPAGLAIVSLDVPPLRRRMERWLSTD